MKWRRRQKREARLLEQKKELEHHLDLIVSQARQPKPTSAEMMEYFRVEKRLMSVNRRLDTLRGSERHRAILFDMGDEPNAEVAHREFEYGPPTELEECEVMVPLELVDRGGDDLRDYLMRDDAVQAMVGGDTDKQT